MCQTPERKVFRSPCSEAAQAGYNMTSLSSIKRYLKKLHQNQTFI